MGDFWNRNGNVLTPQELRIKGLKIFGYNKKMFTSGKANFHYHRSAVEFTVIFDGTYNYYLEDKQYIAKKGSVIITTPNQMHGCGKEEENCCEAMWFQIDLSTKGGLLGLSDEQSDELKSKLTMITTQSISLDSEALSYIKDCVDHMKKRDDMNIAIAQSMLVISIYKILQVCSNIFGVDKDIFDVIKYIDTNITSELSVEELADISGLSLSRFKHKFKLQVGDTPNNYVNKCKIDKAKQLLTSYSIAETSDMLKFTTPNYFATVFKKFTDKTPTEFINDLNVRLAQEI